MSTRFHWLGTVILLATYGSAQVQKPPPAPKKAPIQSESFLDKVLRISGISANPTTLRGPGDEVVSGEIWLAEVESKKTRQITSSAGYRSPIFMPAGDILALRGSDLVRVKLSDSPQRLYTISGIIKLVGFSLNDPDQVLLLKEDAAGGTEVGVLKIGVGTITKIAFDKSSESDRLMLEHLEDWTRVYGTDTIYVSRQQKQLISGPAQWTDVFLKSKGSSPVDLSQCEMVNCGQPSLSADKRLLVFVKSDQN